MTSSTSVKKNFLPPGLVSNLEDVLRSRKGPGERGEESKDVNNASPHPSSSTSDANLEVSATQKPVILVTNSEGIDSPGLTYLVEGLVREGSYNVHVCAPQSDKSVSSHSVTLRETVAVSSAEINGVTAYEVSGTPVDCVSLALSGALFSWSKPLLVISGINRGSSCGHQMFYSGVVAGAREALICGVPSISISLNWKKDQSQESDFKDAVSICLPLINAAISDIEKGNFPKSCSLNVDIPTSPMTNKGFKSTKQSLWRSTLNWQAVSANRYPAGHFMSNQQSLGLQLAQLGRDASAAGAARRLTTQRQNMVEIETTGAVGKSDSERVKKFFRMEFLDKEQDHKDDDLDFTALENGFVAITPFSLTPNIDLDIQTAASDWISTALHQAQ
ncbi:5'/3'-nucleotidase SurE [Cucumis melo var. makuwa]|uniref:5'/3'-nucleotidase SurE n=2 Tax=Cucumis melo TaxID=3656 RepID=A0A5D3BZQ8_CUCMM|nr:acid phosphatase [Cucumis melo subsp. melo]TYK03676.1 5'/3'-nucleotidase SurE [Cucumis melo var. makuwa]